MDGAFDGQLSAVSRFFVLIDVAESCQLITGRLISGGI
jgi:hypothetical protein